MTGDAEELARLTHEANVLITRTHEAYQTWVAADAIMRATIRRRDELAAWLRTAAPPPPPTSPTSSAPLASAATPASSSATGALSSATAAFSDAAAPAARRVAPETSTRTVQNLLFILGGLLLGIAAIVFTAVAWATFGVGGRAAILGIVTLIALALPAVALWRRLRATAETFAAVGLLLVLLDGYAAWAVDLFGVRSMPGARYAGLVCAVTAAVGLGYRAATRLVGPAFAAVIVAQPVLPLLLVDARPSLTGWASVSAGVAAIDLLVVLGTRSVALRVTGSILCGTALFAASLQALWAEVIADTANRAAWAGAVLVLCALVFASAAALTRSGPLRTTAAGAVVLAVVIGAGRFVSAAWPDHQAVLIAAVIAGVALLVAAASAAPAGPVRTGSLVGSLVATGALGFAVTVATVYAAVGTIARAQPMWSADLTAPAPFTWQLPAAIGLAALAAAVTLRGSARLGALAVGGVLALLAVPASFAMAWWAPSVVDIAGAVVLATAAELPTARGTRGTRKGTLLTLSAKEGALPNAPLPAARGAGAWLLAAGAAVLVAHAVPASLARPELTAAILGVLVVVGLGFALPRRGIMGAPGVVVALSALPPAVGAGLVGAEVPAWWAARLTAASVALVLLALVAVRMLRPSLTWYAFGAALVAAAVWPIVGALSGPEPVGVYAAASMLAVALTVLAMPRADSAAVGLAAAVPGSQGRAAAVGLAAAVPGAVLLGIDVLPAVLSVAALPYGWVSDIWAGTPRGTGLAPVGVGGFLQATDTDAVALAVLAVASATFAYAATRRLRSALAGLGVGGPTAILVALAAAGAEWPAIPAVTLLMGLCLTVAAGVMPLSAGRTTIVAAQGIVYIGAALAGSLTVEWATIAAFGSTVVAASVVGAAGRSPAWRVSGWLAAVAAALATASSAGFAADLPARDAAFGVLGAAVAALALGAALSARRPVESVAASAAAHSGAVVALLFTVGWATHAAAICTVWGVAVGLRALWPGTDRAGRARLAAVAAGFELFAWWLLIADRGVALIEAYTLPLAAVALLAGLAALRARPELRSWVAYGPALAAAFLPSLGTILGTTGDPYRRLALGAGALAVVVAGSLRRRRAPVVVGGLVLLIVALHEIAVAWQLLPGWLPIGLGGVILVLLAITYERRRRDVRRLREALARMT